MSEIQSAPTLLPENDNIVVEKAPLSPEAQKMLASKTTRRVLNVYSISLEEIKTSDVHYYNVDLLKKFLTIGNRIVKTKFVGIKSKDDKNLFRKIVEQIKIARIMSLLPYPGQKTIAGISSNKR